jgi:hypothetical protein
MSLVDDIRGGVDDILSLRDQIGAVKKPVYFFSRVWGEAKGRGTPVDTFTLIQPSPRIVEFQHDLRVREGGNVRQGDIMLKGMSQETYPTEAHVDCSVNSDLLEKYYCIDGWLYEVVSVNRKYVTWNILIRKTSKNRVSMP